VRWGGRGDKREAPFLGGGVSKRFGFEKGKWKMENEEGENVCA